MNAPQQRTCGTCSLCCKVMAVPELDKPQNAWCGMCTKKAGCSVHSTEEYASAARFEACRTFECGWLQSQRRVDPLPLNLRPDKCHVVLTGTKDGTNATVLHVDTDYPNAYRVGEIGRVVNRIVSHGWPVFVVIGDKRKLLTVTPQGGQA